MMLGTLIPRSSEDFSDRSLNMLLLDFIMKVVKVLDYSFFTATAKSLQSCQTLCDPIDGSLPGSPVPGILQARTLEWVAISLYQ